MPLKPKNTICLWFDKDAHDAARFYAATFPNSAVTPFTKLMGDAWKCTQPVRKGASISRRVSEDRMAAAGAMLTAIFSHAADRSGLKAD